MYWIKVLSQVQKNDSERYKLYEYDKKTNTFNLIAMEKETVKWSDLVYLDPQTLDGGMEIRNILLHYMKKYLLTHMKYIGINSLKC